MKLKLHSTALILGIFMAIIHTLWSLIVYFDMAKLYLDWIFGLHFLSNPFIIDTFRFSTAITLVLVTFIFGYLMGWVFAFIWNKLHKA